MISNAKRRGVPLNDLLERARLKPGVVDIASFARGGYSESLPLEMALESRVLVAYMMDGEPLPIKHGFHARLGISIMPLTITVGWLPVLTPTGPA